MKYWKKTSHPNFLCVFADNGLLVAVEGAHLECVIKKHPAMDPAMHLLPENVLVTGGESIPGLLSSPTGKSHQSVSVKKQNKIKSNSVLRPLYLKFEELLMLPVDQIAPQDYRKDKTPSRWSNSMLCLRSNSFYSPVSQLVWHVLMFSLHKLPLESRTLNVSFWQSKCWEQYLPPSVFAHQDEGLFLSRCFHQTICIHVSSTS